MRILIVLAIFLRDVSFDFFSLLSFSSSVDGGQCAQLWGQSLVFTISPESRKTGSGRQVSGKIDFHKQWLSAEERAQWELCPLNLKSYARPFFYRSLVFGFFKEYK